MGYHEIATYGNSLTLGAAMSISFYAKCGFDGT